MRGKKGDPLIFIYVIKSRPHQPAIIEIAIIRWEKLHIITHYLDIDTYT